MLRLDAQSLTDDNNSVIKSWADSSGNRRDFDQYRGTPVVIIGNDLNEHKVVRFDGYSQLYSNYDFGSILDDYSMICLIRHYGNTNQIVIGSIGTAWAFGLGDERSAYWKMGSNLLTYSPNADQNWHLLSGTVDADGKVLLWRDSFLVYEGMGSNDGNLKPRSLALGGSQANENYSQSEVAEILLYNRRLKDTERIDLEDYLKLKWFSEDINDFPVLVRMSTSEHPDFNLNTFADPQSGGDLRFFSSNGDELAFEVEEWNASTGESNIWVKLNQVVPDLKIFAYWGNENNTSSPDYRSDGSTWRDFEGVWHFSDFSDSSEYARDASSIGSPTVNNSGISGKAIQFDGEEDRLTISNYKGRLGNSARSIETWIKTDQTAAGIMSWGTSTNRWNLGWNNQGIYASTNNSNGKRQSTGLIGTGEWKHILISYTGNQADLNETRIYLNGRLSDSPSSSIDGIVNTGTGSDLLIGTLLDEGTPLNGWLDETRISSVSRSQAWARLSYENQRPDQTFFGQDLQYLEPPALPLEVNLTMVVGSSFQFQIISNPPATYYETNGTLPGGISFNPATGILEGIPSVSGDFEVNATAYNGKGSSGTRVIIQSKTSIDEPIISKGDIISTTGREAEIRGKLESSGGTSCSVTLYYGFTDQNESVDLWDHYLVLGSYYQGYVPISLSELDSGQTYYYRLRADNSSIAWSDVGSFTTSAYDQGILRINTGTDESGFASGWYWDRGNGDGEEKILSPTLSETLYFAPDGTSWTLTKATFSFDHDLHIGSNLDRLILEGSNILSIESTGNLTISKNLICAPPLETPHILEAKPTDGHDLFYANSSTKGLRQGKAVLGGYSGGQGPGKGLSGGLRDTGGISGGGGSFAGEGGPGGSGAGGIIYGEASLKTLLGGSGGGMGNSGEAGAGGGAIELIAGGKLLISHGTLIDFTGGTVFVNPTIGANYSGGAGSGGAIRLVGASIANLGILDVRGGHASGADPREPGAQYLQKSGGAGGGGRIAFISDGEIQTGSTLIDGGLANADGAQGLAGSVFISPRSDSTPTSLALNEGTLVFDTSGSWKHSSGMQGKGTINSSQIMVDGRPYGYSLCEFNFSNLVIGSEVIVVIKGTNSLSIRVENNATIGTDFILNGKSGQSEIYSGMQGPGGWASGRSLSNADQPEYPDSVLSGNGPGGGSGYGNSIPSSAGGSHGGIGSGGLNEGSTGFVYGDNNLTHLVGGSGGGRTGGRLSNAGGGGGAISITAGGTFVLEENSTIAANGGKGISFGIANGAGGAGGVIRIEAGNILNYGRIEVLGGDTNGSAGAGSGGRISFISNGIIAEGNVSVAAGINADLSDDLQAEDGIFAKITAPVIPVISNQNLDYGLQISPITLGLTQG